MSPGDGAAFWAPAVLAPGHNRCWIVRRGSRPRRACGGQCRRCPARGRTLVTASDIGLESTSTGRNDGSDSCTTRRGSRRSVGLVHKSTWTGSYRDEPSEREFRLSGLCQVWQDRMFLVPPSEWAGSGSRAGMRGTSRSKIVSSNICTSSPDSSRASRRATARVSGFPALWPPSCRQRLSLRW